MKKRKTIKEEQKKCRKFEFSEYVLKFLNCFGYATNFE